MRIRNLPAGAAGLHVVFNDGEQADGFFKWRQPHSRALIVKYARQIGART